MKHTASAIDNAPLKAGVFEDLMAYENGSLGALDTLNLFSHLVRTGMAWTLQGAYGRQAARFIDAGWLDNQGNILREPEEDWEIVGEES